jgi:hypothetical protein
VTTILPATIRPSGIRALTNNTTAGENTAIGADALSSSTTGNNNTATGASALHENTIGFNNTANGDRALFSNTSGDNNTVTGAFALQNSMTGNDNTANGVTSLLANTTGFSNTACGCSALFSNTTGSNNIGLGRAAGQNVTTANNVIAIGTNGANVSNSCYIGQIYTNVQPQVGTDPDLVTINSDGRLGRANVSSRRYKHDIQPMHTASEAIYQLKPVSFLYHKQYDRTQTIAFGLIAEEVAEVHPDLVGRNPAGQPESVRYEQINAMLLNEFLKEHRKVEQLRNEFEATVAQQQKEIQALTGQLKEQATPIQKVSAQLELSQAAPQTVLNNP